MESPIAVPPCLFVSSSLILVTIHPPIHPPTHLFTQKEEKGGGGGGQEEEEESCLMRWAVNWTDRESKNLEQKPVGGNQRPWPWPGGKIPSPPSGLT